MAVDAVVVMANEEGVAKGTVLFSPRPNSIFSHVCFKMLFPRESNIGAQWRRRSWQHTSRYYICFTDVPFSSLLKSPSSPPPSFLQDWTNAAAAATHLTSSSPTGVDSLAPYLLQVYVRDEDSMNPGVAGATTTTTTDQTQMVDDSMKITTTTMDFIPEVKTDATNGDGISSTITTTTTMPVLVPPAAAAAAAGAAAAASGTTTTTNTPAPFAIGTAPDGTPMVMPMSSFPPSSTSPTSANQPNKLLHLATIYQRINDLEKQAEQVKILNQKYLQVRKGRVGGGGRGSRGG